MSETNSPILNQTKNLENQIAALLLYQSVFQHPIAQAFLQILQSCYPNTTSQQDRLRTYGQWFHHMASDNISWQDFLIRQILHNANPFSQQSQIYPIEKLSPALIAAVKHDLQILQNLYQCDDQTISDWVQNATQRSQQLSHLMPDQEPYQIIPWQQPQTNCLTAQEILVKNQLLNIPNWADAI
ncbi:MAG: AAA+ family ATPase, partial [Microcoleaceae cyanobacterium]